MFTAEQRDRVREQLLARAEADSAVTGAAFTGSHATGDGDRWSDTDLVLAVHGDVAQVLHAWTRWLYRELGAQHHWDLCRALAATIDVVTAELERTDPALAVRLRPMLAELAGSN